MALRYTKLVKELLDMSAETYLDIIQNKGCHKYWDNNHQIILATIQGKDKELTQDLIDSNVQALSTIDYDRIKMEMYSIPITPNTYAELESVTPCNRWISHAFNLLDDGYANDWEKAIDEAWRKIYKCRPTKEHMESGLPPNDQANAILKQMQTIKQESTISNKLWQDIAPYIGKLISNGLVEKNANGYKWKKSKVLLSYLCGRLFCGDVAKKDEWKNRGMMPDGYWGEIEKIFNVTDLAHSRDARKDMPPPRGYDIIDKILSNS